MFDHSFIRSLGHSFVRAFVRSALTPPEKKSPICSRRKSGRHKNRGLSTCFDAFWPENHKNRVLSTLFGSWVNPGGPGGVSGEVRGALGSLGKVLDILDRRYNLGKMQVQIRMRDW